MKCFGITDIGRKRSVNQDCFGIKKLSDDIYIIAAFDGMGGANGGEIASATAMESFLHFVKPSFVTVVPKRTPPRSFTMP